MVIIQHGLTPTGSKSAFALLPHLWGQLLQTRGNQSKNREYVLRKAPVSFSATWVGRERVKMQAVCDKICPWKHFIHEGVIHGSVNSTLSPNSSPLQAAKSNWQLNEMVLPRCHSRFLSHKYDKGKLCVKLPMSMNHCNLNSLVCIIMKHVVESITCKINIGILNNWWFIFFFFTLHHAASSLPRVTAYFNRDFSQLCPSSGVCVCFCGGWDTPYHHKQLHYKTRWLLKAFPPNVLKTLSLSIWHQHHIPCCIRKI